MEEQCNYYKVKVKKLKRMKQIYKYSNQIQCVQCFRFFHKEKFEDHPCFNYTENKMRKGEKLDLESKNDEKNWSLEEKKNKDEGKDWVYEGNIFKNEGKIYNNQQKSLNEVLEVKNCSIYSSNNENTLNFSNLNGKRSENQGISIVNDTDIMKSPILRKDLNYSKNRESTTEK